MAYGNALTMAMARNAYSGQLPRQGQNARVSCAGAQKSSAWQQVKDFVTSPLQGIRNLYQQIFHSSSPVSERTESVHPEVILMARQAREARQQKKSEQVTVLKADVRQRGVVALDEMYDEAFRVGLPGRNQDPGKAMACAGAVIDVFLDWDKVTKGLSLSVDGEIYMTMDVYLALELMIGLAHTPEEQEYVRNLQPAIREQLTPRLDSLRCKVDKAGGEALEELLMRPMVALGVEVLCAKENKTLALRNLKEAVLEFSDAYQRGRQDNVITGLQEIKEASTPLLIKNRLQNSELQNRIVLEGIQGQIRFWLEGRRCDGDAVDAMMFLIQQHASGSPNEKLGEPIVNKLVIHSSDVVALSVSDQLNGFSPNSSTNSLGSSESLYSGELLGESDVSSEGDLEQEDVEFDGISQGNKKFPLEKSELNFLSDIKVMPENYRVEHNKFNLPVNSIKIQ
ncbi:hypothetical protein QS306_15795 [Paraburkholderia bonniea]|nr:hypothetical protein [Paraburkholderia bonniea]WJF91551.1 hypothetical protein QS306_15795 [Paraburkholderia bonniea]WJF94870.1 hypothetical protein QS308_15800 [Paraburkholderia bonniea]